MPWPPTWDLVRGRLWRCHSQQQLRPSLSSLGFPVRRVPRTPLRVTALAAVQKIQRRDYRTQQFHSGVCTQEKEKHTGT